MSDDYSVKDWPTLRLVWETDPDTGQKFGRFVEERMDISRFITPLSQLPEVTGLEEHGEDGWTRRGRS